MTGSGTPDDQAQGEQRPPNASEIPPIDLAKALRLEQEALALQDLEATLLPEWASPEDEEAFSDL